MAGGRFIPRALRTVYKYPEGFLMVVFTLMLLTDVLIGILARYVQLEVVFATELGKYIFIWLCCIGISSAAKDHQHIRLDYFAEKLKIPHNYSWLISQFLFLGLSLAFTFLGAQLTIAHIAMSKSAMGFQFPMFLFTAAIPIGFLLTSIRLIQDIVRTFRNIGTNEPVAGHQQ